MKNIVYTLLLSICFQVSFAQVKGVLYYKKTIDDKQTVTPREENYIVYFANNKSLETLRPVDVNSSNVQTGDNSVVKTVSLSGGKKKPFIFKDFIKNELKLADRIDFKLYFVEDTLASMKWQLSNETMTILKYKCTRATTNFRGRNYTAWFTDQLPMQNGPWKFSGLPGLIVKVSDDEKNYTYELEGVDFKAEFDTKTVSVPESYKDDSPIAQKEFISLYQKKVNELEVQAKASVFVKGNVSGSSRSTIPPKMEKF